MVTLLIFILLITSAILIFFRITRIGLAVLAFAIVCFMATGNGILPTFMLNHLQTPFTNLPQPEWKKNNAIVLLGGGAIKLPGTDIVSPTIIAYSRINETVKLYFNCMKSHNSCKIIISGGDAAKVGTSEANIYQKILTSLGINNANMILEPNSMNTYKNAELSSVILKKNKFDQVILVTSGIHLRRALLYFSHFGIHAKPALADYLTAYIAIVPLGYNFAMADFAAHEYLGILRFHLYNFFGLNTEVAAPGVP